MASIVVAGDVLRRPRGSDLATHLHYLIGLRKLGHEVAYLEQADGEPAAGVPRAGIVLLCEMLRRCRVDVPVVWVDPDAGLVGGMLWPQLRRRLGGADLLLDLGGHCWLQERSLARRRVLLDTDSGAVPWLHGHGDGPGYDMFFSYRREASALGDVDWLPTIPPVVPRLWYGPPTRTELPLRVRLGAGAPPGPGEDGGCGISPGQLLALPGRISPRPWTALGAPPEADAAALERSGWTVRSSAQVDESLSSYRRNMIGSQALLSLHSGEGTWFTSLDAGFLAAGRPVIAPAGDLDSWLPTGSGLITFTGVEGAVAAIERVQAELHRHAAAARSVAERVFHFRVVLPSLLEQALPRRLHAVA